MIQLSLKTLNEKSPYQITIVEDDGYDFVTSQGIHYTIALIGDQPLGGCETFQFIDQKVEHQHSSHDPKVGTTILTIVDQFFRENLNVLLYICDDSDGREAKRNRLFLSWFNRSPVVSQSAQPALSLKDTDSTCRHYRRKPEPSAGSHY